MNKITVSAPGKLMLLGEHAVVYGKPCLVTAVNQRMQATVELTDNEVFQLEAPGVKVTGYKKPMNELGKGEVPKRARFVEMAVRNFLISHPERAEPFGSEPQGRRRVEGLKITTKSQFSSEFGFGSSSASTVCIIKALSELTKKKLSSKEIFDLSYKTVLDIQGKGSGFDVAAAIFGGTLYFVTGGKVIQPLNIKSLPLIVGYSGIKADTVTLINEVSKRAAKFPEIINGIYLSIGHIVEMAKIALLKKDWQTLGELMNLNQGYLAALGVGSRKLSNMNYAAREAGAYGAKLSGAGVGDCMIALAPLSKISTVKKAIEGAGGQIINVKTNVEGIRIE